MILSLAARNRLARGQLCVAELPDAVDLSDLLDELDDLRRRAQAQGVEWGACLRADTERLEICDLVAGWADGVTPRCLCNESPGYAGFAHVHLPDAVGGRPYFGFSELDFRATLADGDNLALVTNGPEIFVLVRTADCTLPRQIIEENEFDEWDRMYAEALHRGRRLGTLNACLWEVNRELCRRLGFALYAGAWGDPLACVYSPDPRRRLS